MAVSSAILSSLVGSSCPEIRLLVPPRGRVATEGVVAELSIEAARHHHPASPAGGSGGSGVCRVLARCAVSVMKLALQELSGVSGPKRLLSNNMSSLVEGKSFSINNFSENLSKKFQNFSDNAASLSEELVFLFFISTPPASCSLMLPAKNIYIR